MSETIEVATTLDRDPSKDLNVYLFNSYKEYLRARIEVMPGKGRGELRRIAGLLRIHTTRASQVLSGEHHFSLEQAVDLAHQYLGFGPSETEFFILLLQRERSGSRDLTRVLDRQIESARAKAKTTEVTAGDQSTIPLNEPGKATFYSSWLYSVVQLMTSIDGLKTEASISERLQVSLPRVKEIVEFLIRVGLCLRNPDGSLEMGTRSTFVPYSSLLYGQHHENWRVKALAHAEKFTSEELTYTAAVSIPRSQLKAAREVLLEAIRKIGKDILEYSEGSETVAALTIDWFEVL